MPAQCWWFVDVAEVTVAVTSCLLLPPRHITVGSHGAADGAAAVAGILNFFTSLCTQDTRK